jgi:hypothetical protein
MNEQNTEYLKERLFYLGFGDKINLELQKNIAAGKEAFQLPIEAEYNNGDKKSIVKYDVDFAKSKTSETYFLNKYTATLKGEDPSKDKSQLFYINKGNGVTAKEAFNLLEGRAVYKKLVDRENNPYEAWLQLNFKEKDDKDNFKVQRYFPKYGFDLEKALSKLPVKELDNIERKTEILKSLEKGNTPQVTYQRDAGDEKMFLAANPKERKVDVYDDQFRKQFQGIKEYKGERNEVKESKGQEEGSSKKQKGKEVSDEEGGNSTKKSKGRKMSV